MPREPHIIAYLACSLDGFIADPQGGVGWLDPYGDADAGFSTFMKSIGVMAMGRKTFDDSRKLGPPPKMDASMIVLTHRPLPDDAPTDARTLAGPAGEIAAALRREAAEVGRDVWLMGGGEVLADFLDAGEVDVLEMFVMPVLLGDGVPLFPRRARSHIALRMDESRTFPNGVVQIRYVIAT